MWRTVAGAVLLWAGCGRLAFDETVTGSTGSDGGSDGTGATYAAEVLFDTPAVFWSFDDASGLVTDSSGNARHGTVIGSVDYRAPGIDGGFGMRLQGGGVGGDGGAITLGGMFSFPDRSPFTIECWYQPEVMNAEWRILAGVNYWTTTRQGYTVEFRLGELWVNRRRDSVDEYAGVSSEVFMLGVWTHVATVYDGSQLKLYVDGTEIAASPSTLSIMTGAVEPFGISHPVYTLGGIVDDCAVWDRALTPQRIAAHFAAR